MKVLDRNDITPVHYLERKSTGALRLVHNSQPQTDRVSLSTEVVAKQRMDAARAEAIKQAIDEGRYQVDLERLARSFVEKELS